ncbi:endonuclease domain-containing 1 protein-like [Mastacembelus armatus]|uniref:endonuclease domain-containing 1 protein-like n=1 Tax=Mastacembelus armatus TaxID=205130 RepID=UPI000E4601E9|nr:endonuclease domain-containing 1 protein-like [Mastacembelus armatus]XP_026167131.1 endonuclease domain-containing 1 protein-like [Mastacembelus armatus]
MQSLVTVCGLLLLCSVQAHVVKLYEDLPEDCKSFFHHEYVPLWNPSKYHVYICQFFKNKYRFTTLYDTDHRIPVYSGYIVENREKGKGKCSETWKIEPQLVDEKLVKDMMLQKDLKKKKKKVTLKKIKKSQAVFEDYKDIKDYNRGHLNPAGHHKDEACEATYTLTNVVPQYKKMNNGLWSQYEERIKTTCPNNKLFVLVGAIPSSDPQRWIKKNNKNRVNIPDYLWHAYCCVDNNNKPVKSGAAVARNTENNMVECSLDSLNKFFNKLNKKPKLFDNCNINLPNTDPPKTKPPNPPGDCSGVVP